MSHAPLPPAPLTPAPAFFSPGCILDGASGNIPELNARLIALAAALGGPTPPEDMHGLRERAVAGEEFAVALLEDCADLALTHMNQLAAPHGLVVEWVDGDLIVSLQNPHDE